MRTPFLLYFVEGLDLGEVAERVGDSPGATWKRIKRVRDKVLRDFEREQRTAARRAGEV